jgi:hypothetical protein
LVVASLSGFEDPCKLHLLFLLIFVSASHFVSVLLSGSSTFRVPSSSVSFAVIQLAICPSSYLVSRLFPLSFSVHVRFLLPLYFLVTLGIGLRLQSPRPVDTGPVLHHFLVIRIMPFVFCSFVLWDTSFTFSVLASVSPLSSFFPSLFSFVFYSPSTSDYSRYRPSSYVSSPCRCQSRPSSFLPLYFRPVFCARSMVQPVSTILILIGLGFRFYSRQSIITAQPVLLLSIFVPTHYASSSFLLFILPSCYFPAKFNVLISFAVVFCNLEPRHQFLSIGCRLRLRSRQCLHGFAIVFPILHQIPVVIRSPDLWLPFGFSVSLSRLPSPSFVLFLGLVPQPHLFRHNLDFLITTVYSYLSISFFAFDIRCPCSPTCIFVPRVGLFYRRRPPLHPSILSPRLISDFLCPSQFLPFFSLYSLLMARLWRFGFLFCSSVSSLSRASVLRRHHCHPLRYSIAWSSF